jgi:ABC-2 type transport system permease protein
MAITSNTDRLYDTDLTDAAWELIAPMLFPRFLMPDAMKNVGLFTFNSWAIEGYTKVFWRDQPVRHLGPEVSVLLVSGFVLFLLARWFARRWESA